MNHGSCIAIDLIRVYEETHYCVLEGTPLTLLIGIASVKLGALYDTYGVRGATFVTAYNPFSRPTDDATNGRRQRALKRDLKGRGWVTLDGIGQHPSGVWPGEPSVLVLGISSEEAIHTGTRYEQNAIVTCGADAVPRLVLLR